MFNFWEIIYVVLTRLFLVACYRKELQHAFWIVWNNAISRVYMFVMHAWYGVDDDDLACM